MWRCDRKDHGCKARLHTNANTDVVEAEKGNHVHATDAAGIEVAAAVSGMKRRANETPDGNLSLLILRIL